MADFYEKMKATASRLITEKGQLITFTREIKGAYDPDTGGFAPGSLETFDANGAVFDYSFREIDGVNILNGDCRCYLEATDYVPDVDDTCVIGGVKWRVQDPMPLSPSGIDVIYDVQLRK